MDTFPSNAPLIGLQETPTARRLPFSFSGSSGEYFRIWIVNVALTILTLGIYGAWAKVRTRRYFYGHTWLDGHNFEYTANPISILIGHLIVGSLFALYTFSSRFGAEENTGLSVLAGALLLVFFLLTPYLVYKSLRFLAHNTVYRGLRFRFHGTLAEAYGKYLGWPLLAIPTLGLLYPYVAYLQRRYLAGNAGYGTARTTFSGNPGDVYVTYLISIAIGVGAYMVFGLIFVLALIPLFMSGQGHDFTEILGHLDRWVGTLALVGLAYLALVLGMAAAGQYLRASLMNYTLNHSELAGQVRVHSTINPFVLAWIQVSNVALQVVTLGLATPWAAVRRVRYILPCIALSSAGSLDDFSAEVSSQEAALGEVATEFFGIDLGF